SVAPSLPDNTSQAEAANAPAAAPARSHREDAPASPATGVFTYHNNLSRTGLNPNETILTPQNVNSQSFGKLFANEVDGYVYPQPLFVPGVSVPDRGTHNIVYVATENDSVYAFDADESGPPVWHASLLEGGSAVPSTDFQCDQIVPKVGITGTPVIDPATRTLYVVAMVKHDSAKGPVYAHRLHALDIATGEEKFGGPVSIAGSVPGIGEGQVNGTVAFDPFPHLNRAGLALADGVVYIAFASHCDMNWFHGWVFAYSAGTPANPGQPGGSKTAKLSLRAVFNTTPNGFWGSIWQAGAAPAIDAEGHIFVVTGNGTFGNFDFGDSFLKLRLQGNSLRTVDSFTPYNQKILDEQDIDLGASGPVLLPDQPGSHPHLAVGAGKSGAIYLLDRDRMGRFVPKGKDRQIVQVIRGAIAGNYATPAYWNGYLYMGSFNDSLKAFSFSRGRLSEFPVSKSDGVFGYPGASPSVSADQTRNGIVWALQNDDHYRSGPTVLHAYDATDLSRELYNSSAAGARDMAGPAVKFTSPTIANGKVYLGTQNSVDVYGLLD
ncbi:MAG: pyrrolo-quinoline quinone, partial [Bryobacteraceae bacterium]